MDEVAWDEQSNIAAQQQQQEIHFELLFENGQFNWISFVELSAAPSGIWIVNEFGFLFFFLSGLVAAGCRSAPREKRERKEKPNEMSNSIKRGEKWESCVWLIVFDFERVSGGSQPPTLREERENKQINQTQLVFSFLSAPSNKRNVKFVWLDCWNGREMESK